MKKEILLKKHCSDCLKEVMELCKKISKSDSLEKITEIYPKFVKGKYDSKYEKQENDYYNLLIKHESDITSLDSFKASNIVLSEIDSIKKYYKGKVYDEHGNQSPEIREATQGLLIDFLRNYLESVQSFKFDNKIFNKVFSSFRKFIKSEIQTRYYFSPLHNLEAKTEKGKFDNDLQIKRVSLSEFKEIANLGAGRGRQGEVFPEFWPLTHVICYELQKPDNFYNDNKLVEGLFKKFLQALKIFESGDVQLGALYRQYSPVWKTKPSHPIGNEYHMSSNNRMVLNKKKLSELKKFYHNFQSLDFQKKEMKFLQMAINRFSSAVENESMEDRIVDYIIALESILLSSPSEASLRISARSAVLLGGNDEGREFLWKFMRQSYNLRSGIVHGEGLRKFNIDGKSYDIKEITMQLETITRNGIKKILNLMKIYKNQKEILDELDLAMFNRTKLTNLQNKSTGDF